MLFSGKRVQDLKLSIHVCRTMSFQPLERYQRGRNNIIDEEHVVETMGYQLVYTGNYDGCLFITAGCFSDILFHESAQEYLHDLYLSCDTYNEMKEGADIVLDLYTGRGNGWHIDFNPHNNWNQQFHFMKEGARAYIDNGFLYIDDTGEFGPYSIPTCMIDNLMRSIHTPRRVQVTWNNESKTNEIVEAVEEEEEEEEEEEDEGAEGAEEEEGAADEEGEEGSADEEGAEGSVDEEGEEGAEGDNII